MKKLLLLLIFILFSTQAIAATYYMRADGTAANKAAATGPPSSASACMSIATHNGETFSPGDNFGISSQGGDYDCSAINIAPPSSGSSGNPITYRAVSGETPVLDAAGARAHVFYNLKSYINIDGITFKNATTRMLAIRAQITSITGFEITNCTFNGNAGGIGIQLYCEEDRDVSNITISNCTFQNLDNDGIRFYFGTAAGTGIIHTVTIKDCTFASITNAGAACHGIDILFSNLANALAADRFPYGLIIRNNIFNEINASAIRFYSKATSANFIANNIISYAGYGDAYAINAIQLHSCKGLIVEHNDVSYTACSGPGDGQGIILDWANSDITYMTEGAIVRYNNCHHNTDASSTGAGGISAFRAKDCQIYYNTCHNNVHGIKMNSDAGGACTGNVFYNNTIINNTNDGVLLETNSPITTWTNNIIANNGGEGVDDNSANDPTFTYNCLYNNTGGNYSGFTLGAGCIETDPQILSVARNNFRIGPASSCRNAGTDVSLTRDFEGKHVPFSTAQDIGAFERHPPTIGKIGTQVLGRPYRASDRSEIFGH